MQRQRQLEEVREEEQLIKAWAGSMEEAAASLLGARLKVSHSSVMATARPPPCAFLIPTLLTKGGRRHHRRGRQGGGFGF